MGRTVVGYCDEKKEVPPKNNLWQRIVLTNSKREARNNIAGGAELAQRRIADSKGHIQVVKLESRKECMLVWM